MSSHKDGEQAAKAASAEKKAPAGMKAEIRRQVRGLRRLLIQAEKDRMDELIRQRLLALKELQGAKTVYSYMSYGREVDTVGLMKILWAQGIQTAVPRVEKEQIFFYLVSRMDQLAPGCKGILEPVEGCERACDRLAPVITPGMAFSLNGDRIGYGGGYYDRFFRQEPEHIRIAAAYPFQIYERLETEECDQKVHRIVTPEQTYITHSCTTIQEGSIWN